MPLTRASAQDQYESSLLWTWNDSGH